MNENVTNYDRYRLAASSKADPPSYGDLDSGKDVRAAAKIASAINGLTFAVLALAESNRPEPVRVEVKVEPEDVAAKVSEIVDVKWGGRKVKR